MRHSDRQPRGRRAATLPLHSAAHVDPLGPIGGRSPSDIDRLLLFTVVVFLVTNRMILAIVTIPVGVSIHPSVVVLGLLTTLLFLASLTQRLHSPRGPVAMWGIATLVSMMWMPFLAEPGMTEFQSRQFDQGLIHAIGYAALFIAAHHLGYWPRYARIILGTIILVSAAQAAISIIELLTRAPFEALNNLWLSLGLQLDPRGIQGFVSEINARATGELRPASTAPHPIILSALMALSAPVAFEYTRLARQRLFARISLATALLSALAFASNNSRTGYVVAAVVMIAFLWWHFTDFRLIGRLALGGAAGVFALALVSPGTLRFILNLVTFTRTDNTAEVRFERIPLILDYLERRPFLGAGYMTHSVLEGQVWDNGYLHALTELGMIGTGMLLAFLVTILARIWRHSWDAGEMGLYARIGAMSVLALGVAGISVDIFTFYQFLPLALAIASVSIGRCDVLEHGGNG